MSSAYRVDFVKSAKKEFDQIPQKIQDRIVEALQLLSANPFSELLKIKKLKGVQDLYRIRLGDYRAVYEIKRDSCAIVVIKIGHRGEVYRHL